MPNAEQAERARLTTYDADPTGQMQLPPTGYKQVADIDVPNTEPAVAEVKPGGQTNAYDSSVSIGAPHGGIHLEIDLSGASTTESSKLPRTPSVVPTAAYLGMNQVVVPGAKGKGGLEAASPRSTASITSEQSTLNVDAE